MEEETAEGMNAEIIAVGTELLLGQIANTNAAFLSKQMALMGIDVYYHTSVGDNAGRLEEALSIAERRAKFIILTGGLGPTDDDLTKETVAKHLGISLEFDPRSLEAVENYFSQTGRRMTENNKKQALVLKGCTVLGNDNGMAPGMLHETDEHLYILLPGPPSEMEPMFQFKAKPLLVKYLNKEDFIISHVLRFYGIGEAELESRLKKLLETQKNPTIAPLALSGEVTLRITAKSETEKQAWVLINKVKEEILGEVGDYLYGYDDDSLASKTVETLKNKRKTLSAAESLTAGLFQSEIASIPGASAVLSGGLVVYNEETKIRQLGISKELISKYGVVSEEIARAMAEGVRQIFRTDVGVALTGAAGPEAHGNQPPGTVWIAISTKEGTKTFHLQLTGRRNTNRLRAVKAVLYHLLKTMA